MEDRNFQPPGEHDPTIDLPADFSPRERPYIHFDKPVAVNNISGSSFSKAAAGSHEFMPFVGFVTKERRYYTERDENGNFIRDEDGRKITRHKVKEREIKYASHFDSVVFSYYAFILSHAYETVLVESGIDECVLAYRSGQGSNIHHAKRVFDWIRSSGDCTAIAIDISKFFDRIDHKLLLRSWREVLSVDELPIDHYKVYRNITRYAFAYKHELELALDRKISDGSEYRICNSWELRKKVRPYQIDGRSVIQTNQDPFGIPQGSPISGLLANMYLLDFDRAMEAHVRKLGGDYLRYSDDLCILLPSGVDASSVIEFASELISNFKLEINKSKTEVSIFREYHDQLICDKPFQYLGFTYDGKKTLIRQSSLNRFYAKMTKAVRAHALSADAQEIPRGQKYQRILYKRYTHLGKGRNFVKYAFRAAKILDAPEIRRQVKRNRQNLEKRLKAVGAR